VPLTGSFKVGTFGKQTLLRSHTPNPDRTAPNHGGSRNELEAASLAPRTDQKPVEFSESHLFTKRVGPRGQGLTKRGEGRGTLSPQNLLGQVPPQKERSLEVMGVSSGEN